MNTNGNAPEPKPEAIPERGARGCYHVPQSCAIREHLVIQPGMTTNGIAAKGKPEAKLERGAPELNRVMSLAPEGKPERGAPEPSEVMTTNGIPPKPKPVAILEPGDPEPGGCCCSIL